MSVCFILAVIYFELWDKFLRMSLKEVTTQNLIWDCNCGFSWYHGFLNCTVLVRKLMLFMLC